MILFVPYYTPSSEERKQELEKCLQDNLDNEFFHKIVLLLENDSVHSLKHSKLDVLNLARRATYRDWIEHAMGQGMPSLFANADICFQGKLDKICLELNKPQTLLAISRHDEVGGTLVPHPNPHWSQDCWGIGAIKNIPDQLLNQLSIPVGIPRCDNRIAYLFAVHGWRIVNPFPKIQLVHRHASNYRTYKKRGDQTILGGTAYVHPQKENECGSKLDFSIWVKNSSQIQSIALNKTLENWEKEESSAEI
jgi:hypothetical protein